MFDSLEQIQARIPKLLSIKETKPYLGENDKFWQERMGDKKFLSFYELIFDPKVIGTKFVVVFNVENNQIEHISIFVWDEKVLTSEEVVKYIISDKYVIDHQRGGHGGYDLFLKKKIFYTKQV